MKYIIAGFFVIIVFLLFSSQDNLEVYAIKYGESSYRSDDIYEQDYLDKEIPFAWMFYVIKYKDRIILIDTGFQDHLFIEKYYRDSLLILEDLDIKPAEVTDIIVTHSHFDHIGNVDKFPDAKIYIQKEELANFPKKSNNIVAFDGSYEIGDFLKIEKIGGHTIGSSIVRFKHKGKEYILTGDECYLIDNCLGKPIGAYYNIENNKKFINSLESEIILPFHDPLIFERYRKINDWIARII